MSLLGRRRFLASMLAAMGSALVGAPAAARAADDTEARIRDLAFRFDAWARESWLDFRRISLESQADVRQLYVLEDAIAAYANMAEATGEVHYLERALELVRGGMSIHPWTRANGSRWWHEDMKASLSSGRVASLAREAGLDVDDVVTFVDVHILGYHLLERPFGDHRTGLSWAEWVHTPKRASKSAGYWHGFQTLAARIAWDLAHLGVRRWDDFAKAMPEAFESRVSYAGDGAALWDVGRMLHHESLARTPDTGHYNRTVRWVVEARRDGAFSDRLIEGLARSFTQRIYHVERGQPAMRNYIDGRDLAYGESVPGSGYLYDGWLMLGAHDREVQQAGEAVYGLIREGPAKGPTYHIHNRPTSRLAVVAGLAVNERRKTWTR